MGEPALTFDASVTEDVIESFGWSLTSLGYIWDEDAVFSITGQPVHVDELAGVVEYVKYRHEREIPDE